MFLCGGLRFRCGLRCGGGIIQIGDLYDILILVDMRCQGVILTGSQAVERITVLADTVRSQTGIVILTDLAVCLLSVQPNFV